VKKRQDNDGVPQNTKGPNGKLDSLRIRPGRKRLGKGGPGHSFAEKNGKIKEIKKARPESLGSSRFWGRCGTTADVIRTGRKDRGNERNHHLYGIKMTVIDGSRGKNVLGVDGYIDL